MLQNSAHFGVTNLVAHGLPAWFDPVANGVATLIGAFVGAALAFASERWQRRGDRIAEEVGAGSRALSILVSMWNILIQYQRTVIEKSRGNPGAWLNLDATPLMDYGDRFRFDMKDLSFLLEANPTVFHSLLIEEQRFDLAISVIRIRSDLILSTVFPRLAAAGIGVGEQRPVEEVEARLGLDIVHQLKVLTGNLVMNVDEDVASVMAAFIALRAALKKIHPKRKFLDIRPLPPASVAPAAAPQAEPARPS